MKKNTMLRGSFWLFCVFLSTLLVMPGYVNAQKKGKKKGKGAASKKKGKKGVDSKDAARAKFKSGVELFKEDEYAEALEEFLASYELYAHPKTLVNIANCYEELYDLPSAMEYYAKYLKDTGSDITEDDKADVKKKMDRMSDKVGLLEVVGDVDGELIVDGKSAAQLPLTKKLYFGSGTHSIVMKSGGKIIFNQDVNIPGGSTAKINIEPKSKKSTDGPGKGEGEGGKGAVEVKVSVKDKEGKEKELEKKKPPKERGLLHISSTIEGSSILINDKEVGASPLEEELKEGMYAVKVSSAGFPEWEKVVEVRSGKTTLVDVDLKATKKVAAPWWWITAGAAVVCTGLWAGFGITGLQAKNDAEDIPINSNAECAANPDLCNEYNDLVDKSETRSLVADITGPLALAFIGGSLALGLLIRKEKKKPKATIELSSVSPFIAPESSGGGLSLTGSF